MDRSFVDAFLNNQYIGSFHVDPGIDIIDLGMISDGDSMGKSNINTLELVHNNSFVPALSFQGSKDIRNLTVSYKEISIRDHSEK